MNYFLIPGNPPAVHFYEEWGKEIQANNPGAWARVSHYPDLKHNENSEEAMQEVLEAHFEQLQEFVADTKGPVTIVGHSLGGHFALALLTKAPEKINKAILLHPFLRKPTSLGVLTLNAAAALYGSDRFHRVFLGTRKGLELFFGDLAHVKNEEVKRAFHLARHESRTIGRDTSKIEVEVHLRDKIQVFYNRNDIWCTSHVVNELKKILSVEECPEPHAFVTSQRHRMKLFKRFVGPVQE